MKYKNTQKKMGGSAHKGKNKFSLNQDPFFEGETKKRRKINYDDDDIESGESEDYENNNEYGGGGSDDGDSEVEETADEKRKRVATAYLEKIRGLARREKEEGEEENGSDEEEKEGERDSLVAKILQQEQLEESGRVRRVIASRVQEPQNIDEFRVLVKHRQSVTAVALSEDEKCHQLMGRNVLSTSFSGTNKIRAYAHCAKQSKGITLLLINLDRSTAVEANVMFNKTLPMRYQRKSQSREVVRLPQASPGGNSREEYHLTAKDGALHSQAMLLNGRVLSVNAQGDIPPCYCICSHATC